MPGWNSAKRVTGLSYFEREESDPIVFGTRFLTEVSVVDGIFGGMGANESSQRYHGRDMYTVDTDTRTRQYRYARNLPIGFLALSSP